MKSVGDPSRTMRQSTGTGSPMKDYADFSTLAAIYLEDSYVLDVQQRAESLSFLLEAVLTPNHPRYRTPLPGEQYCYVRARLSIVSATRVNWLCRNEVRNVDPDGEVDLGNIDSMKYNDGWYEIVGEWGHVRVRSDADPQLIFSENAQFGEGGAELQRD